QLVSGLDSNVRLVSAPAISQNGLIAANSSNGFAYLLVPAELMVDANRDGQMSFSDGEVHNADVTTSDKPYRFWLNDDDDGAADEAEHVPASNPDYGDGIIRSKRDLE